MLKSRGPLSVSSCWGFVGRGAACVACLPLWYRRKPVSATVRTGFSRILPAPMQPFAFQGLMAVTRRRFQAAQRRDQVERSFASTPEHLNDGPRSIVRTPEPRTRFGRVDATHRPIQRPSAYPIPIRFDGSRHRRTESGRSPALPASCRSSSRAPCESLSVSSS